MSFVKLPLKSVALLAATLSFSSCGQAQTVVADLARDFGGQTANSANWSYLWNQRGPISFAPSYIRQLPSTIFKQYGDISFTPDGTADLPSKKMKEAGDLALRCDPGGKAVFGDCGLGPDQGAREERYNIMAFKVPKGGQYSIVGSSLNSVAKDGKGFGLHYRIYVNDNFIKGASLKPGDSVTFDCDLGILQEGDTIYFAVGPGHAADVSGFNVEYQIASR